VEREAVYERILLAADGSDNAELAAERAIEMADCHDAALHVLYVAEKTTKDPARKGVEDVVEDVEARATERGIEVETTVESGVPRTKIESYAADRETGLTVLGSTGASGVTEKLVGTVAKYVVNEAPADVFVVRPDSRLE
jgi:nucleotide-binding universal stress UspA family protein